LRARQGLQAKKNKVLRQIGQCRGLVVALSGGVDSAVLLALSLEALGPDQVVAVTGRSVSLPGSDLIDAQEIARQLGARHEVLNTDEISLPAYRSNRGDRCFHCRTELFRVLLAFAATRDPTASLAYGAIADDLGDVRPGMRAAERVGVLAPLLDAAMTKEDVRSLARAFRLSVRDKPAGACLASRIPVGTPVTPARLDQVGLAERALRDLGFEQFRVRHHGDVARIESDASGECILRDPVQRATAVRAVRAAGFRYVALDLEGYRTGSMNL
jgi:uncharacterized protein